MNINHFGNIYKSSWFGDDKNSIGWGVSYNLFRKRIESDGGIIEMQRSVKKDKTIFF